MFQEAFDIDDELSTKESNLLVYNTPLELSSKYYQSGKDFDFALPSGNIHNRNMVVEEHSKYTYPTKLLNSFDRENYTVSTDHCYARPWNWRPEASFLRPTKTLFVPKDVPGKKKSGNPLVSCGDPNEDIVDVDKQPELPTPVYDIHKARAMMEECERHASSARPDRGEDDWEDKISKSSWTTTQNRIFSGMVNILNSFRMAKLAQTGVHNEPLLRRTVIDKAVQRVRRLLATVSWDSKLTQWLYQLLIDNLDPHYLALYLDILQTLKAKLPTFIDKMMYGPNSSLRLGCLNNSNLTPLLEKHWDPVAPSLHQDKPKKLPSNPIIIVVPTGPVMSKMLHKWIKLLSHLATVVTIPTNFGSTGHRMTMTSCLDQLFSITRGKIQDVKADYPGRHIILVGFGAGATLALQLAQVESVLCVVSLGFSLLTAEGRRGEPDDNLLELQCPVLFVIGQCSNTSSQEDMEDLRERMRVETGLIVVGAADDYLRVSKKKKKIEGITQSIVDRCIIDEVGEFISGIILSPYPPQIRQSPNHIPMETTTKKGKERQRYNSNTSSLDSEPPSPTPPRIPRKVGRPPGSKAKSRLETKWAQQIAQGNSSSTPTNNNTQTPPSPPNSPPPPYPTTPTPDTSSNDSSQPEKVSSSPSKLLAEPQVKKIKTLKPVVNSNKSNNVSPVKSPPSQGANLSTLLQGGIKTIPPSQPKASPASSIKVLENVTLNSSTTAKLIQNRTIDLSKITLVNSIKGPNTTVSNVVLLPDGKLKTIQNAASVKGTGSTPIMLPLSPQKTMSKPRNKYITAKRQLMGQRPPRPVKTPIYLPTTPIQQNLPPPTNLTTQDIMDLPIIFADDNQILEPNNVPTDLSSSTSSTVTPTSTVTVSLPSVSLSTPTLPRVLHTVAPGKFMLVNKQPSQGNYIITSTGLKPASNVKNPMTFNRPPPKYTKIILSAKKHNLEEAKSKIQNLSPEITIKKVATTHQQPSKSETTSLVELIDLENEIKATAVPKPNVGTSDIKNITIIPKSSTENINLVVNKVSSSINPLVIRRPSQDRFPEKAQIQPSEIPSIESVTEAALEEIADDRQESFVEMVDDEDPDYVPSKRLKFN